MRFASSGGNSATSRKESTCRSGSTRTCVAALGLMSCTATKPSARATWSPSLTSRQNRQSSGSEDPLLRHGRRAGAHEAPDRSLEEPRRVVIAVAAAGPVDEDNVLGANLLPPVGHAGGVRRPAEPR